jgi:hypothetical protein
VPAVAQAAADVIPSKYFPELDLVLVEILAAERPPGVPDVVAVPDVAHFERTNIKYRH